MFGKKEEEKKEKDTHTNPKKATAFKQHLSRQANKKCLKTQNFTKHCLSWGQKPQILLISGESALIS